jgi:uncharacterized protein (TIGR04255 family)
MDTETKKSYLDEEREVYPNAQLQLVAAEVRYPFSPRLGSDDALSFFVESLGDVLPIAEPIHEQTIILAPEAQPDVKGRSAFRLASRDRTTAATLTANRVALETTDYQRYGEFRRLLLKLLEALDRFSKPAGVERMGLRYIDEIRVPGVESVDARGWERYVDRALVAPTELAAGALPGMRPRTWNGVLQFETIDEQATLVLRYGALEGHVVDPSGPLRLKRRPGQGTFFLFDIDSFWNAEEVIADFDVKSLMTKSDQLHRPISSVFERCITDRLRDEVLRKETLGAS